jgi:L-proline amide hydrolase
MKPTPGNMQWKHGNTWYRTFGDFESGLRPVVVLHGGPGMAHNYCLPIAQLIAQTGRPVVIYDQLGCGNSTHLPEAPADFWTPELFMEELQTLVEFFGIQDDYSIIGQSWGGMLGMQFATHQPRGLKSLIVADSPASMVRWVEEANKLRAQLPDEVQAALLKHEAEGTTTSPEYEEATNVFYSRHVCRIPFPQDMIDSMNQMVAEPTVYFTMNGPSEFHCIGSLKTWDIRPDLGNINVPTLLISGRYDEATPEMVSEVHGLIPGSKWELFEESSHTPHFEEPAKFARIVNSFLNETGN